MFEEITTHNFNGAGSPAEAKVCLTFSADKIGKRGHFSRLFTSTEWDNHYSAMSSGADLHFYFSSSSATSEASDSEESYSEDRVRGENGTNDDVTVCRLRGAAGKGASCTNDHVTVCRLRGAAGQAPTVSNLIVDEDETNEIGTHDRVTVLSPERCCWESSESD